MRRMRSIVTVALLAGLSIAQSGSAATIDLGFSNPVAVAFDAVGILYVLESTGEIRKVDPDGPTVVGTISLGLDRADDLVVDANGNLVIAEAGASRVLIATPTGEVVAELPFTASAWVQRVVRFPDGSTGAVVHDEHDTRLHRVGLDYELDGAYSVAAPCSTIPIPSVRVDAAVDESGSVWVVDINGCGTDYTMRKYGIDGTLIGSWQKYAGQLPDAVVLDHSRGVIDLVADVFAGSENVFVVLGAGGAENGGVEIDVWSLDGAWERRVTTPGPARPVVRGVVRGEYVYLPDTLGAQSILSVALSEI